jgi:hypothetical protein
MRGEATLHHLAPTVADLPDQLRLAACAGPITIMLPPEMAIQLAHDLDAGAKARERQAVRLAAHEEILTQARSSIAKAEAAIADAVAAADRVKSSVLRLLVPVFLAGASAALLAVSILGDLQ